MDEKAKSRFESTIQALSSVRGVVDETPAQEWANRGIPEASAFVSAQWAFLRAVEAYYEKHFSEAAMVDEEAFYSGRR